MPLIPLVKPYAALLRALALTFLVFLAVYLPVFAIAGSLRLPLDKAVPAVMLGTFATACLFIGAFARSSRAPVAAFGIAVPQRRYLALAIIFSVPLGGLVAWVLSHFNEPGPLAGLSLPAWKIYLYFVIGAPIQEEVIFRGLLQSQLARWLARISVFQASSTTIAMVFAALLFASVHLAVGPMTAAGALVLAALAGRLRQLSGSVVPGIVCHAIFNLAGILWVAG